MADMVNGIGPTTSTLYFQVWNSAGLVYNGSTFEAYNASNWATYDIAMTEKGTTGFFWGTFPTIDAGAYTAIYYEQAGGSPAEGDSAMGASTVMWDGSAFADFSDLKSHGDSNWATITGAAVSGAVLTNTDNKITADANGEIAANNEADIGTAVWASGTRTLSTYGTLVADVTAAVWANGTRTLSSFGTLVADTATAVWGSVSRTLTAMGFTVTATGVSDIKAVTDKLDDTLEDDGGTYRFTENSLEEGPGGGDATAANQTTIAAAIAALHDPTAAVVAEAVMDATVNTGLDVRAALGHIQSFASGKMVRTATNPLTYQYYAYDNNTLLFTIVCPINASGRTRS